MSNKQLRPHYEPHATETERERGENGDCFQLQLDHMFNNNQTRPTPVRAATNTRGPSTARGGSTRPTGARSARGCASATRGCCGAISIPVPLDVDSALLRR